MKTKLMPHQERAKRKALQKRRLALFHKMGRGKTLTALATLLEAHGTGLIDCAVILAPAYLKRVWRSEIQRHFDDQEIAPVLVDGTNWPRAIEQASGHDLALVVFIASIESLSNAKAVQGITKAVKGRRYAVVIDEATAIKTPSAKRTRNAWKVAHGAALRLALTGTPITNGMENLYAIYRFLGEDIIGIRTYTAFKARYCVMGGFEQRQIVGYRNKDELLNRCLRFADVQETDPEAFPDRLWQTIELDPTAQQGKALDELKRGYMALNPDDPVAITTALEYLLRAQQVLGGAFDEIKKSPKHDAALQLLQELTAPAIVWFRFKHELRRMAHLLEKIGMDYCVFHGDLTEAQKHEQSERFRKGTVPVMLTTYAGARGQTWTIAPYAVFFSRSFSYEDNEQAAARNWGRIGQKSTGTVVYYDLVIDHPLDRIVAKNLMRKRHIAEFVIRYLKGEDVK